METIYVVAAVIKDGNRILVTQRGYGEFNGFWEFPGGKIEQGETAQTAIIREIKEELDVDITVDKFIDVIKYSYPRFNLIMNCYECHITDGTITLQEAQDYKWVTLNELESLDWLPADRLLLPTLNEVMNNQEEENKMSKVTHKEFMNTLDNFDITLDEFRKLYVPKIELDAAKELLKEVLATCEPTSPFDCDVHKKCNECEFQHINCHSTPDWELGIRIRAFLGGDLYETKELL